MTIDPSDIPVVILCGGRGTRLRGAIDEDLPKPLVPIGDRPVLWHIMKLYGAQGYRRFVLCLGYKGWTIKDWFLRYREQMSDVTINLTGPNGVTIHETHDEDWEVVCADTGLETGTGARLSRVRKYVDTDTFCFTYGDGIGAIDLGQLMRIHETEGRIGTVTGVHPTSRFGEIKNDGNTITEFNEKPTVPSGFVSGGFFAFNQGIFDYLHDGPDLTFETEVLPQLSRDGQLAMSPFDGFWRGMDTYREYRELNDLWAANEAPWKLWD